MRGNGSAQQVETEVEAEIDAQLMVGRMDTSILVVDIGREVNSEWLSWPLARRVSSKGKRR